MLRNILSFINFVDDTIMNRLQQYSDNDVSAMGQVELESRALVRTASALNNIKEHWDDMKEDLPDALEKNRRLWAIIASAMGEADCLQPEEIRKNILNLSLFVFQRTIHTLAEPRPEDLSVLININMNIAKGLSEKEEVANP